MTHHGDIPFLSILRLRRDHCRGLLELSRQQTELIRRDEYTQLLALLGKKQHILGRLDEISARYPQLARRWKDRRDTLEPEVRSECETLLAEIENLLAQLNETENDSAVLLTRRRDETRQQLEALSTGARTHDGYREALAPADSRHLDVKS